jgi:hypothetical protein
MTRFVRVNKFCLCYYFSFIYCFVACGQSDSLPKSILRIGVQTHYGSIFAHSPEVENTSGSYPWGIQVEANWQKISQKVWDNCLCYPKSGILFSYYNYNNAILGHSVQLSYFLEPTFKLTSKIQFSLRGIIGLSYLTNPFDSLKNPYNRSYSLPISAYLTLATGLQMHFNDFWQIQVQANYQHISNGGIKDPNKGINWITASLGVLYTLNPQSIPHRERKPFERNKHIEKELIIFLSNKGAGVGQKSRFMILGGGFQIGKQISRLNALNIGTEAYWDGALAEMLRQQNKEGDAFRWALLGGHQFVLGKFRFGQQVGIYLYNNNPFFHWWYHRWGLIYSPKGTWAVGFNMKAHKHIANFLDLRLVHRF